MAIIVSMFGVLAVLIGIVGIASPQRLAGTIGGWDSPARFWFAIGIRVLFGIVLIRAAPVCRLPIVVSALGIVAIVAALGIGIAGRARLDALIGWWIQRPTLLRLSAIVAIGFGVLLVYAGA